MFLKLTSLFFLIQDKLFITTIPFFKILAPYLHTPCAEMQHNKQFIPIYLEYSSSVKLHEMNNLFKPFFLEVQTLTKNCAWLAQICAGLECKERTILK